MRYRDIADFKHLLNRRPAKQLSLQEVEMYIDFMEKHEIPNRKRDLRNRDYLHNLELAREKLARLLKVWETLATQALAA